MNDLSLSAARMIGSCLIIIGLFVAIWAILYYGIKADVKDVILLLLGALIASYKDVTNFLFSSTASSAAKDRTIATLAGLPKE